MLPFVVTKYNKTVHSSTGNTPNDGHKHINSSSVIVNLTLKAVHKRKYPTIEEGDHVKIDIKGKGIFRHIKRQQANGAIQFIKLFK